MKIFKLIKKYSINSIRKQLIIYLMLLTLIMLVTSIYSLYNANKFMSKMNNMFDYNRKLSDLSLDIKYIDIELSNYLTTENTDSYDRYNKYKNILSKRVSDVGKKAGYDTNHVLYMDVANMIDSYIDESEAAIKGKRSGDISLYNTKYRRSQVISGYIKDYINKLNLNQFQDNTELYFNIAREMSMIKKLNIVIILNAVFLSLMLIMWITNKISHPIIKLADAAEEISCGNFDVKDVCVDSEWEIKIMAEAFNKMKKNIKTYIEEIHEQSEIKSRLMDEKMQNLKMKNLLKNAELKSLQSQINPHFLFNTLNAGVELAMMEDAERTEEFIQKLSDLFRYSLKDMDRPVTLREEVDNFYTYTYILKTRFGDSINFETDIDKSVLNQKIPAMIIQPIVENAIIHGIGNMESGGRIRLTIKDYKDMIKAAVEDNGKGMDKNIIHDVLNLKDFQGEGNEKASGHLTGIGLKNVIQRMKIFFNTQDVMEIISAVGKGTAVILKIPKD